ncbi:hypothetical protein INT47_003678 [Mucor saturninus]|uniref:Uncharacterized protein n=1 Tax=Mucor saturninus TaxID=64648 RepID=A0A8H7V1K8_9FUNG|nr:hypothetical protein INT47_003678 [Mucor saturninus]
MTTQLKSTRNSEDQRKIYKADGVVRTTGALEILLLETAGPFGHINLPKLSFDNIKGMFGSIPMIKTLADKYRYCSKSKFRKLVVNDTLRLWSLKHAHKGTYTFERIAKAEISENYEDRNTCLAELTIIMKNCLQETLDAIQEDHNTNMNDYDSDFNSFVQRILRISFSSHSKSCYHF